MATRAKPNLKQVAELAGVSEATVDRVLNGRGGVRPAKEASVLKAAKELNIDRNLQLVPLKPLRFAVLMHHPERFFYKRIYDAIDEYQKIRSIDQFTCNFLYFPSQTPEVIRSRIQSIRGGFDGAIIVAYDHPFINDALQDLAQQMPLVTIISDLPNCGRSQYIGEDNRKAGRLAADMMARFAPNENGDILILSGNPSYLAHAERETGFRQVISSKYPKLSTRHILQCKEGKENHQKNIQSLASYMNAHAPFLGIYNISQWNADLVSELKTTYDFKDTIFISHGLTLNSREMLIEGVLDAVIDHEPEYCAQAAVDTLLEHHSRIPSSKNKRNKFLEIYMQERLPENWP